MDQPSSKPPTDGQVYYRKSDATWVDAGSLKSGIFLPLAEGYEMRFTRQFDPGVLPGVDMAPGRIVVRQGAVYHEGRPLGGSIAIPCYISRKHGIRVVDNGSVLRLVCAVDIAEALMSAVKSRSVEFDSVHWGHSPISGFHAINAGAVFDCKIESSDLDMAYFPDQTGALYQRNLTEIIQRHATDLYGQANMTIAVVMKSKEWPLRWEMKLGMRSFTVMPTPMQQHIEFIAMSQAGDQFADAFAPRDEI